MDPLRYDPRGALLDNTGISGNDLFVLGPKLNAARDAVVADVQLFNRGGPLPPEKNPLDAGFIELPDRLLEEYQARRATSELQLILNTAGRLQAEVDRVVVLGIGGSYMGARALLEACCHPYHNELSRESRRGIPRMYFEGNNVDNDAVQGLLDLLPRDPSEAGPSGRWALVVISKGGETLETAAAFRVFLRAMLESCGGDPARLPRYIVPVCGPTGRLASLVGEIGCQERFVIPDGVGGRFSVLTAVGLLPAAILGLDIRQLLAGASAMTRRLSTTKAEDNPVMYYTAVCHLMEKVRGANLRILSAWAKGLEAVGMWYDQLLSESLGKHELGATPLTTVNTRDLHSRHQQHQEGCRDKLITNLVVESWRREPVAIGASPWNLDHLDDVADRTYPQLIGAARGAVDRALADDRRPTANIVLPRKDEASLGQLFQMLMLATALEGRLIGVNPYGQPGVQGYKKYLSEALKG